MSAVGPKKVRILPNDTFLLINDSPKLIYLINNIKIASMLEFVHKTFETESKYKVSNN